MKAFYGVKEAKNTYFDHSDVASLVALSSECYHTQKTIYLFFYSFLLLLQVSIPEIVPGEYRPAKIHIYKPEAEDNSWMHPLTGNARRYIMGDRFHASVNPHKSPLCAFHDINLCAQGNSMKTSYQESENHRKNALRLRSSCMQSFSVHFLYNFLMDYYQNEKIVELQRAQILKSLVSEGEKVVRDEYCRFIIVQSDPK